jgi:putative transposase
MPRKAYITDLSDAQWELLRSQVEKPASHGGTHRKHPLREIVNALLYVAKTGCQWRMIPHDFPPWDAVYDHYRRWKRDGTLERVHSALRTQVRAAEGREPTPSAGVLDSQSAQTTEKGGRVGTTQARRSKDESATS